MKTPYIGFGNETLNLRTKLGESAKCPECGTLCKVKDSKPPKIQFIHCEKCNADYLVGIEGKSVVDIKPDVSGEVNLKA